MTTNDRRSYRYGWHMIGVAAFLAAVSIALNAVAGAAWYSWLLNGVAVGAILSAVVLRVSAARNRRRADELYRAP